MTNNTQQPQPMTANQLAALKRDDLRKYAAQLGIKSAAKYTRPALTALVIQKIDAMTPAVEKQSEKKTERVRTSHADCKHASTKVARAKCRRERAKKNES